MKINKQAWLLLLLGAISSVAFAQTISPAEARSKVAQALQDAEALYSKVPRLREVDRVVRLDCAAKNEGQSPGGAFCGCASAMTLSLWRSGIDPNMVPRLKAFSADPNASAAVFTAYQGPELYGPVCHLAEK